MAQHVTGARRQVIASAPRAFRHKCGFGVWRSRPGTGPIGFAMVDPATGGKVRVAGDQHFAASADIQLLMRRLLGPLNDSTAAAREARRGLCTLTFYSTLAAGEAARCEDAGPDGAGSSGQPRHPALVALGYNRPLGEGWRTGKWYIKAGTTREEMGMEPHGTPKKKRVRKNKPKPPMGPDMNELLDVAVIAQDLVDDPMTEGHDMQDKAPAEESGAALAAGMQQEEDTFGAKETYEGNPE